MPEIKLETHINASVEKCFDLFRDIDLHEKTSSKTKEKAIAGRTSGLINEGEEVTFEAVHFGIRQRLTVKILECKKPYLFVDEMKKGAFKYMKHEKRFEELPNGTLVRDRFVYVSPLGILGRIFDKLFLEEYMRRFLIDRNIQIKKLAEKNELTELSTSFLNQV